MKDIHNNDVNNIFKYNLLHDILNSSKRDKILTRVILLSYMGVLIHVEVDSACRSTIVIRRRMPKLQKKYYVM